MDATLLGPTYCIYLAWSHSSVGTCCILFELKPVKLLDPYKQTQYCWPTTLNNVVT